MRHRRLVWLVIAGAALLAAPAIAAEPATLVVGPTRVEFLGTAAPPVTVTISVSGGEPGSVRLELVDAAVDPTGGWRAVPLGSTEASLDGLLSIEPSSFVYAPNGETQTFDALLSVDSALVTRPLFGSLRVVLDPDLAASSGVTVVSRGAVSIQVLAAPEGAAVDQLPASAAKLSVSQLSIVQIEPWTPVDAAIPDIPWVVNHGPILVSASGENSGTLVLDSRVSYAFTRLSPIALFTGGSPQPVFTVDNRPRYLLAGAPFKDTTTSLIPVEGAQTVDSLPLIGFVRVSATVRGELVGIEAEPVMISRTFLVFPWKESLFLFVVWLFQREWRHRKGRKVKLGEDGKPIVSARTRIRERLGRLLSRGDSER